MKKSLLKTIGGSTLILAAIVLTLFAGSCKKSNDTVTNFAGNYVGTDSAAANGQSLGTQSDTMKIAQASGSSSIVITSTSGAFSPAVTATVSGNNITIPSQANTFNSLPATVSGTGTLSGTTLKLYINFSEAGTPIANGTFVGVN